jgi:hypothetical protein
VVLHTVLGRRLHYLRPTVRNYTQASETECTTDGCTMEDIVDFATLRRTVEAGNLEALADFVKRGVKLNKIWPESRKPLLLFVRDPGMATAIIGYGADVNSVDDEGFSALQNALMVRGNSETVRTLIRLGADFSRVSNYGYTAIQHATTLIEAIRESPFNPNATAHGESLQLNVAAYEEETQRIIQLRQHQVAFAMGLHPRLGAESNVLCFSPDLLRMILTRI